MRGYMAKWGTDCNGDGQVDCADYAAIHKVSTFSSCHLAPHVISCNVCLTSMTVRMSFADANAQGALMPVHLVVNLF